MPVPAFYLFFAEIFVYGLHQHSHRLFHGFAAELRAGNVDRAVETLKAYPDYSCKALGVIAERDRLERELARSRRRLKRVIWASAIVLALVLFVLFS